MIAYENGIVHSLCEHWSQGEDAKVRSQFQNAPVLVVVEFVGGECGCPQRVAYRSLIMKVRAMQTSIRVGKGGKVGSANRNQKTDFSRAQQGPVGTKEPHQNVLAAFCSDCCV